MDLAMFSKKNLHKSSYLHATIEDAVTWSIGILVSLFFISAVAAGVMYYNHSAADRADSGSTPRSKQLAVSEARKATELLDERIIRFGDSAEIEKFGSLFR